MREGYEKKNCETSWKYLEWSLIRTRSSRPIGPLLLFEVSLHLAGRDHTCLAPIINVIKRILINLVSWHFYLYSLTLANLKICDPILFFIQSQIFTISDHCWNETKYDLIVKFRFSSPNNPSSSFIPAFLFFSPLPSSLPRFLTRKLKNYPAQNPHQNPHWLVPFTEGTLERGTTLSRFPPSSPSAPKRLSTWRWSDTSTRDTPVLRERESRGGVRGDGGREKKKEREKKGENLVASDCGARIGGGGGGLVPREKSARAYQAALRVSRI